MLKTSRFPALLLVGLLTAIAGAWAQGGSGSISGHVTDASGAVLQGAQVDVQPRSSASTVSNQQGEFTVLNLAPGNYTVTVSYVGFATFSKEVAVAGAQTARVDAVLGAASTNQEVVVYAEREHGEAEAINRTRASDNIVQVLPSEVITSLPNTNIADALGRLPSVTLERDEGEGKYVQIRGLEPRLSNVTVNGINVPSPEASVRQIKLDTIPANLVDSIEINKTQAANQDGDAIGGSVNLVTKTAGERPTLYLNGVGGYTPIVGGRSLTELDGTIGKRFGANHKLGILIGSSYDWNGRGIDDVEPVPTVIQCDPGPTGCVQPSSAASNFVTYGTQDIREYRYYRTRYGLSGSIDYKLGEISGLYVRGIYSHFDNFGDRWVYSPSVNGTTDANGNPLTSGYLTPTLSDTNGSYSFNAQIRRPVDVIASVEAGGKHVWSKWLLAYDVALSRSSSEDRGYSSADFSGPQTGVQFNIDTRDALRPKLIPVGGFGAVYDPAAYSFGGLDVNKTYSPQINLQGGFMTSRTYTIGGHFGTFEIGAKVRNQHKFQDALDLQYNAQGNIPTLSTFLGSFTNSNYYDKSYTLGPTADYNKIRAYLGAHAGDTNFFAPVDTNVLNTFSNSYDLIERITAGYFMNTVDFGRLRLQAGLRFEATHEDLLGNKILADSNGNLVATPLPVNSSYLDPLPSVQARFRLPHDAAIRAVYGRGVSRPNFGDLPPTFDSQSDAGQKVHVGNPFLKPTHANSYDVLYEQFLKPLGLIQAGFFYKQLTNTIYQTSTTINQQVIQNNPLYPLGDYVGQVLVQQTNGSDAHLYGFELAYQQHLTFLPGPLKGLGITANYGYTASKANNVPGRSDNPQLQRQAPNTWNISPTYDRGRFSSRLGISHNDQNIWSYGYQDGAALGKSGPFGDTYIYAHTQVDVQGSFKLSHGIQVIASGLNLTNEVFGFYNGSKIYPIQREYYKPTYSFGLRFNLGGESK